MATWRSFVYVAFVSDVFARRIVGWRVSSSLRNALAESVIGLFKTEVIRKEGPWRNVEDVEFATLSWVWLYNHHRLLGPIGRVPPAEFEEQYYSSLATPATLWSLDANSLR